MKKEKEKEKHIFTQANKYCVAKVKCFYKMVGWVIVISQFAAGKCSSKNDKVQQQKLHDYCLQFSTYYATRIQNEMT